MTERRRGLLLLVPTLLVMAVFTVYPLFDALRMSFTNENLLRNTSEFIGLENYRRLMTDDVFWLSFRHSIVLVVVVIFLLCSKF